ncbi:MAG: potassium channel family protein [Solirubrobacteraceae bacterium]|nr:potassium channel family protein [Solirubrobacteraceae bacterium]
MAANGLSEQENRATDENPWTQRRFAREGPGVEFERVQFFCDAVFAIAATLIAVEIGIPALKDHNSTHELLDMLGDRAPRIAAFFIAFAVLGFYWAANHRFTRALGAVSTTYTGFVLVYLAFVAFLPFPAGLMGEYVHNPVAVSAFAVSAALVSGMEVALFVVARRQALFRFPLSDDAARWAVIGSLAPVGMFLASVPVMFVNTWVGIGVWVLNMPVGAALERFRPEVFRK